MIISTLFSLSELEIERQWLIKVGRKPAKTICVAARRQLKPLNFESKYMYRKLLRDKVLIRHCRYLMLIAGAH